jgi:hypothetical protein
MFKIKDKLAHELLAKLVGWEYCLNIDRAIWSKRIRASWKFVRQSSGWKFVRTVQSAFGDRFVLSVLNRRSKCPTIGRQDIWKHRHLFPTRFHDPVCRRNVRKTCRTIERPTLWESNCHWRGSNSVLKGNVRKWRHIFCALCFVLFHNALLTVYKGRIIHKAD